VSDRLSVLLHELRSPVSALAALAEGLARHGPTLSTSDRRKILDLASDAAADIERLLTDPERASLRLQPVDLGVLVTRLERPGVSAVAADDLGVLGDPVRLRQALANLIENGLRHAGSVQVCATHDATTVRVAVRDHGPGIAPEIDVFAAGVSGAGSTGHGLALVRDIARAHGGEVYLESSAAGTTVTLVLPSASVDP
jgi:signal transduction histidine kinase